MLVVSSLIAILVALAALFTSADVVPENKMSMSGPKSTKGLVSYDMWLLGRREAENLTYFGLPRYQTLSVALEVLESLPMDDQFSKRAAAHKALLEGALEDHTKVLKGFATNIRLEDRQYHLLVDTVLVPMREFKKVHPTLYVEVLEKYLRGYAELYEAYVGRKLVPGSKQAAGPAAEQLAAKLKETDNASAQEIAAFESEYRALLREWLAIGDRGLTDRGAFDRVGEILNYMNSDTVQHLASVLPRS